MSAELQPTSSLVMRKPGQPIVTTEIPTASVTVATAVSPGSPPLLVRSTNKQDNPLKSLPSISLHAHSAREIRSTRSRTTQVKKKSVPSNDVFSGKTSPTHSIISKNNSKQSQLVTPATVAIDSSHHRISELVSNLHDRSLKIHRRSQSNAAGSVCAPTTQQGRFISNRSDKTQQQPSSNRSIHDAFSVNETNPFFSKSIHSTIIGLKQQQQQLNESSPNRLLSLPLTQQLPNKQLIVNQDGSTPLPSIRHRNPASTYMGNFTPIRNKENELATPLRMRSSHRPPPPKSFENQIPTHLIMTANKLLPPLSNIINQTQPTEDRAAMKQQKNNRSELVPTPQQQQQQQSLERNSLDQEMQKLSMLHQKNQTDLNNYLNIHIDLLHFNTQVMLTYYFVVN